MTVSRTLTTFFSVILPAAVREVVAFLQFTELDAVALLSAYGLHLLEIDRLQREREEPAGVCDRANPESGVSRRGREWRRAALINWTLAAGVHPDFASGNWRLAYSRRVYTVRRGKSS